MASLEVKSTESPDETRPLADKGQAAVVGRMRVVMDDVTEAVVERRLVEEAVDDHDVRKHYADGADIVDDFAGKKRRLGGRHDQELRGARESALQWEVDEVRAGIDRDGVRKRREGRLAEL